MSNDTHNFMDIARKEAEAAETPDELRASLAAAETRLREADAKGAENETL